MPGGYRSPGTCKDIAKRIEETVLNRYLIDTSDQSCYCQIEYQFAPSQCREHTVCNRTTIAKHTAYLATRCLVEQRGLWRCPRTEPKHKILGLQQLGSGLRLLITTHKQRGF